MRLIILSLVILAYLDLSIGELNVDIVPIVGGLSGEGTTTRYWDCCKPTCGWRGNNVNRKDPVRSCAADGVTVIDEEIQSGCVADGNSYICNNQGPFLVDSTLAYGFVAAAFAHTTENKCCTCVLFSFKGELSHKKMVMQVTNTGSTEAQENNLFDIAIPGGGVGYYTDGCHRQWNAPINGWGDQYGGVRSESECNDLPTGLQNGCRFRFEFMQGVSNPPVSFVEVECPAELTSISNCYPA